MVGLGYPGDVAQESKIGSHCGSRRDRNLGTRLPHSNMKGISSRTRIMSMGITFISYLVAERC